MKVIFWVILSGLIACAPKMVLECPIEGEVKVFPEKGFDLQVKFCKKSIFSDTSDVPLRLKIKDNFVKFLEKKGLIYDTFNPDYIIEVYIDTFNIFVKPPPHIRETGKMLLPVGILGSALMYIGFMVFILTGMGGPMGSIDWEDGAKIMSLGTILAMPPLMFLLIIAQYTHYDFKGILHCEVMVFKNGDSVALNKNYNIHVYKKEILNRSLRLNFASQLLCETLQKFFLDFEKDMQNVLSN